MEGVFTLETKTMVFRLFYVFHVYCSPKQSEGCIFVCCL